MTFSFNLIERKWIPCILTDGRVEELSLRETLLRAAQLRGVQGDSPLETAAIYRLLLAVLHSALRGPRSMAEWGELWQAGQGHWDQPWLHKYLDTWQGRFDLFDETHPFYQAADTRVKPKSVITLASDMASGNNGVLFDHHTELVGESLSAARAVRTLLTAQTFGLAGLAMPGLSYTDAPWARGIIFLVEGDNLFQTLALNLLVYRDDRPMPSNPDDCPAWEQDDPHQPARQIPNGYLDYLTWQNRRVMLFPEGEPDDPTVRSMTLGPGLRLSAATLDLFKLYRAGKDEGYLVNRFSEERALWRDSGSLFALKSTKGTLPPKNFYALANLADNGYVSRQHVYRFMALGMANDQAKIEFFHEEHLPLPLAYLEQAELVEQLSSALDLAEQTRYALKVACQWMALLIIAPKADGKKWQEVDRISKEQAEKLVIHWNAERFYWQRLEVPFTQFLTQLPNDASALVAWQETVRQCAWEALERAAGLAGTDAAALKAAVRARASLGHALKELFPESQPIA